MNTVTAVNEFAVSAVAGFAAIHKGGTAYTAAVSFVVCLILFLLISLVAKTRVKGMRNAFVIEFIFMLSLSQFRIQFVELLSLAGFVGNAFGAWLVYAAHMYFAAVLVLLYLIRFSGKDAKPAVGRRWLSSRYKGNDSAPSGECVKHYERASGAIRPAFNPLQ
ncbi:MAG: hypothetical protein LBT55_00325 [Clostridiaceae bacterium]|jgi:hypothetical protein|nr:hypothetical protein [Clostridiaceae bacterium]